jgi:hypothetical protein
MPFGVNLSFCVKRWVTPEVWAPLVREDLGLDLVRFSFDHAHALPSMRAASVAVLSEARKQVRASKRPQEHSERHVLSQAR